MQKVFFLFISFGITLCLHAQNSNTTGAFISFSNEGQTFSINNTTGIKASAQVDYNGGIPKKFTCVFVHPSTSDTLILVATDAAGFITNTQHIFSANARLLFYYKIAGKGVLYKMMDNAKNEISEGNSFSITRFENKPGGLVEGLFTFKDLIVENNSGQVAARIKAITNGNFRLTINDDIVIGKPAKANNSDNENEHFNEANNFIFKTLDPTYIIKQIFKPTRQNGDGYFRWKPNSKQVLDFDSSLSDDGFMYIKYDTVLSYNDSIDKVLIFFATVVYENGQIMDCHACGALMSCAVFSKQPNGAYRLDKFDTVLETNTEWGKPNAVELIKVGANKYAVSIASYDMHQGYEQDDVSYFDTENLNPIFSHSILDDNTGAAMEKGYSNKTTIKFLPAKNESKYFIIQAVTTGTEDNGYGKIKPINKREMYYFDTIKDEYVLQPKAIAAK